MTATRRVVLAAMATLAGLVPVPAETQTRPAALTSLTPYGIQRGTTATFTADGANLMGADQVIFTDPGLSAEIVEYEDLGADIRVRQTGETGAIIQDRAQKGRLTLSITAAAGVPLGRHGFRVRTPLGTTSFVALWVGEDQETSEQEPNDEPADATAVTSPVTVNGWLGALEDVDVFRVHARAGEDLVAKITATPIGSNVDTVVTFLGLDGATLAANDDFGPTRDSLAVYRPAADGDVLVRVTDANPSGGRHHYRLTLGVVPVVTSAFPLGRPASPPGVVTVEGVNLKATTRARLGAPVADRPNLAPVVVSGLDRDPVTRLEVAVGKYRRGARARRQQHAGDGTTAAGACDRERPNPVVESRRAGPGSVPRHDAKGPDAGGAGRRAAAGIVARLAAGSARRQGPAGAARAVARRVGDDHRLAQSRLDGSRSAPAHLGRAWAGRLRVCGPRADPRPGTAQGPGRGRVVCQLPRPAPGV